MPNRLRRCLLAFTFFLLTGLTAARAQERSGGALAEAVARSGARFVPLALFEGATARASFPAVTDAGILSPNSLEISALYAAPAPAISVPVQTADGVIHTLKLLRSQPLAPNLTAGTFGSGGKAPGALADPGVHYQGAIDGDPHSFAALSLFRSGEVMGLFANDAGNFVIGRVNDGTGRYVVYNDADFRTRPETKCGVEDAGPSVPDDGTRSKNTASIQCKKVQLYWEVAYKVYQSKGSSLTATQNYLTGLFNQIQALYRNDRIGIELKSVYIWTAQDDYAASSSSPVLNKFREYWQAMGNGFDGDIAMYIAKDNNGSGGNGGLAYLNVLCTRSYAYGYSDIYGSFQSLPSFSWDVEVISHEMGHNLGSNHTHWCGWNTGANGACGAIDNCAAVEQVSGCNSCGSQYLNSAPSTSWKGTVMSYCHTVSRGISLANGFGPLPAAHIQDKVSNAACLSSPISGTVSAPPICSGPVTASVSFNTNNQGTAPYTYYWTNGSTGTSLGNITTPGMYSVQVTDSNGCVAIIDGTVTAAAHPGNGQAPGIHMPICCQNDGQSAVIRASAPEGLTGCEQVLWLKSGIALPDAATAKAYFDTTAAANILPPSNPSTLAGGATLTVKAPAACTGPVSEWYTPVVVRNARAADSVVFTSINTIAFYEGSTQVGSYATLPDQTGSFGACVEGETPTTAQLAVTVTGYTGRPNLMRLAVQGTGNRVVYQALGLPGNGTYVIPASQISGSILEGLKVIVTDFNCASANNNFTCTASQNTLSCTRRVVYGAMGRTLQTSCGTGNTIRLDFAPTGCTKLAVAETAIAANVPVITPNPASGIATLQFYAAAAGPASISVTDASGRIVRNYNRVVSAGPSLQIINLSGLSAGLYFVRTHVNEQTSTLKLAVE